MTISDKKASEPDAQAEAFVSLTSLDTGGNAAMQRTNPVVTNPGPLNPPEGTRLMDIGFAGGSETRTTHNGKPYMIRTCYEWVGGKWEGFVSMREVK